MALGLVGSRRKYPICWRERRCECTVDDEVKPTASPISRTEGGKPRSRWARSMNSRIWRFLSVSPSAIPAPPRPVPCPSGHERTYVQGTVARGRSEGKHLFEIPLDTNGRSGLDGIEHTFDLAGDTAGRRNERIQRRGGP